VLVQWEVTLKDLLTHVSGLGVNDSGTKSLSSVNGVVLFLSSRRINNALTRVNR